MDWKEAIRIASKPLLKNHSIQEKYVDAMIQNVEQFGPYIVLAPQIAFAHARPEQGVNQTDISLTVSKQPIAFSEDTKHHCKLIFVFSAADNESHLQLLTELSTFLSNDENVQNLLNANSVEEIYQTIQSQEDV